MRTIQRHKPRVMLLAPLVCLSAWAAALTPAPRASALTINVLFDVGISETPGNDPTGGALMAIVNAAVNRWESMILDPWVVNIDISWQQPADMFNGGALAEGISTASSAGKPTSGYIRFNNTKDFFFDPTPLEDEEFNMQQTLYRDLDPLLQASWYAGNVPHVLEVGYRGGAFGGQDPDVYDTDLFSVAIHEMGHVLGMNAQLNAGQVGDFDYDVNPAFVGGAVMDITDSDEHLPMNDTAMYPSIGSGERKRISETDLFAIASAVNWASVSARRKDFLGGGDFSSPGNWISNRVPSSQDDAFVRKNNTLPPFTVASTGMAFGNLSVMEGSWVTTNHVLNVFGKTTINSDNYFDADARIRIQSSGALFTDTLLIDSNATLELLDGTADVNEDAFIAIGGSLKGSGAILVADRLTNNGLIRADGAQTLILTTTSPDSVEVWDLGGSGGGVIEAINGDIFVHGSHHGEFKGIMTVGPDREIDMDRNWTLAPTGQLNLVGGEDNYATFGADYATLTGSVDVDLNARMDGSVLFHAPVAVTVNDANDQLRLEGPAVFEGGSYTGDGRIVQANNITVGQDTTINTRTFLWGNSGPFVLNELRVNQNATFIINSETTNSINNRYIGNIVVANGVLEVNTTSPWLLPKEGLPGGVPPVPKGALFLDASKGGLEPTVRGQKLILEGLIAATGGASSIQAALDTHPTAEISVAANSQLKLRGVTTYNGGNIHGGGTLRQVGDATIVGSTTINTTYMDWDGDEANPSDTTVQPGTSFTIQSEYIEANPVAEGYSGHVTVSDNAALIVITDITWLVDGQMTLMGQPVTTPQAIVDGSPIGNFGLVEGNGWFQNTFANVGTLRPGLSAGSMRFSSGLILYNESTVEVEVGGSAAFLGYDRLTVSGSTFINGALDVSLINGYNPPVGSGAFYDILVSASPLSGTFDAVTLPPTLGILYSSNRVRLVAGLPGDLNGDGFVGIEDLNIVLGVWNQNVTAGAWGFGDASGDGFVGIEDLNTVLGNWNAGTPPGAQANDTHIPEPASLPLLFGGLALLPRLRRTGTSETP